VISNLGSPSTSMGGGGGCDRFGIVFGVAGSSCETWKTGWTARIESGRRIMNDRVLTWAIMG